MKKYSRIGDVLLSVFLYIIVVWASLLIAPSPGGGLPELLENLIARP